MNIYVGNLSYGMDEDGLKALFSEFGEVESAKVIKDKYSGKSKGFGFVEMANDGEGEKAIEGLNEKEIDGRSIKVNKAKPKRNYSGDGGRSSYGGSNRGY